jgi:hypothetical protein
VNTRVTPARSTAAEPAKIAQTIDIKSKSSGFADALARLRLRSPCGDARVRPEGRNESSPARPRLEGLSTPSSEASPVGANPPGAHDREGASDRPAYDQDLPSRREDHVLEVSSAPEVVDPLARVLATPTLRTAPAMLEPAPGTTAALTPDFERMLARLVRRVAFGGDGRRGSARIEIGAGELAGATIVVHADEREVRVEVDLPPGMAADGWHRRLERRLLARGLAIRELVVR